ncbi:Dbl homology domain-containing protein, partial [Mycena polygramma]
MDDAIRPTSVAFSQSSSASSMYEEEQEEGSEHSEEPQRSEEFVQEGEEECHDENENEEESPMDEPREDAWRSTLSPTTCTAIADRYGQLEIHRQEAIHNLCVTEEAFAARLTNTINLFILPLRMQDSKCYISGVPAEIARLFDWLEDILNLHTHLLSALRRVREAQHPVVECVAEAVRGSFVKRLEVYQPYLARLVIVAGTIARLVADNTSDFGEFVRIQQDVEECKGWSLESLLVDPVTRLGMYPTMFRKMHEFTPKVHADYVPTVALLHSTEMVIKVMTEVKIREDEYDLVKSMSQRIKGLPPSVSLAKRGRRLLFQGQLLRVRAGYDATKAPEESPLDDRRNLRPRDMVGVPKRSSKLVEAVHEWDQRRERSGSNASASTMASYSTHSSAASSEFPVTPSSPHFPSRGPLPTLRSKILGSPRPSTPQEGLQFSSSSATDSRSETTQLVQVFVFTDCVVFAGTTKSRYNGSDEWTLLENVGIGRV